MSAEHAHMPKAPLTMWLRGGTRTWARACALMLICSFLGGCADALRPTSTPNGTAMPGVKVLSYNILHGLEPSGLTVKASESKQAREARLALQFRQLAEIQPDVMLLQEVNPLPEMVRKYVTAVKGVGLQYAEVHQVDVWGVRVGPGLPGRPGVDNGVVRA